MKNYVASIKSSFWLTEVMWRTDQMVHNKDMNLDHNKILKNINYIDDMT